MKSLTRLVLRRAGLISLLGAILAALGTYYSILLYKNLRPDLEELLPTTARSVVDLNEVTQRLESIDNLAILVFSDHVAASKRFVTDLAETLKKAPKDTIASVEYRIDRELKFFEDRQALYLELNDLERIRDYIRNRIEYEKELYNPLNIVSGVEIPEPRLDLMGMKSKYEGRASSFTRFPDGFYATPDQKNRVILVNMPGKASGMTGIQRLKKHVEDAVAKLRPQSYSPDLVIRYTGGVQNTIEEQAALVADLELSTVLTMLLCSVGMLWFYRTIRATTALVVSLVMGTLWTFGAAYFAVGYLNANSAFLGSIVLGNGINFGIIFLARYVEERRKDSNHVRAIYQCMAHTATSTWTAALAAGLAYGSLTLTGFRGFRQFGIIGLIGMVLCWISAFTLLPAFLTLFERWRTLAPRKNKKEPKAYLTGGVASLISRHPGWVWGASLAITAAAVAMLPRFDSNVLETDLKRLRNKTSMERGSGYLSRYVDEIFQRYLSPVVILPKTRADTLRIAEQLKREQKKQGPDTMIARVQTIDDFLPKDQPQKIRVLHEIKSLLPPRILSRLGPQDRAQVQAFLNPAAFKPIHLKDLPGLVLSKFTEKDGSVGKLVLVEPPLSSKTLRGDRIIQFIDTLRGAADSVSPGTAVAGSLPISSDMIRAITRDGPKATFFAFVAVVLLVTLLFRNFKTVGLVLFSLILGVLWLAGLILGFDLKINFLNFIALPITFGIGVDYGVNVFQRYREEGSGSILKVVRDTGGAVGLCSLTTTIGYGSLLIAENQAFVSFGLLAVLGEVTCLLAALFALPAFLMVTNRRRAI